MTDCAAYMAVNTGVSCSFFALSLILPLLHSILIGKAQNRIPEMTEILLKYSLFLNIGCSFVFSFIGETFYSAEMAECAGWAWSPFIYEIAFSQLGLGVLGLLCPLYAREFWLATIIGSSVWLWGAAIVHATNAIVHNNYAVGNMGFVFYWDLIIPIWIIMLYFLFYRATAHKLALQKNEGGLH